MTDAQQTAGLYVSRDAVYPKDDPYKAANGIRTTGDVLQGIGVLIGIGILVLGLAAIFTGSNAEMPEGIAIAVSGFLLILVSFLVGAVLNVLGHLLKATLDISAKVNGIRISTNAPTEKKGALDFWLGGER